MSGVLLLEYHADSQCLSIEIHMYMYLLIYEKDAKHHLKINKSSWKWPILEAPYSTIDK